MTDDAATLGTPGMAFDVAHISLSGSGARSSPCRLPPPLARRSRPGLRPAVAGGVSTAAASRRWPPDGCYRITAPSMTESAARAAARLGNMDFAAPMDWTCEPFMIERTGLSAAEHQQRTVANYLERWTLAPGLAFIPVIQGWQLADYLACVGRYASAGVDRLYCRGSASDRMPSSVHH